MRETWKIKKKNLPSKKAVATPTLYEHSKKKNWFVRVDGYEFFWKNPILMMIVIILPGKELLQQKGRLRWWNFC